jgi:hypothetical protein
MTSPDKLSSQFHATLTPNHGWSADPYSGTYSANIGIVDPNNANSHMGGRISWDSTGDARYISNGGDVYDIEGTHKTPGAAVTAFNKQHLPSAKITKKFKNSEVQPLAEQIQAAGGYDEWKAQNP